MVIVWTWARPCVIATMFSERVSTQVAGRAEPTGHPGHDGLLRVGTELRAERATDRRGDHPNLFDGQPE